MTIGWGLVQSARTYFSGGLDFFVALSGVVIAPRNSENILPTPRPRFANGFNPKTNSPIAIIKIM